MVFGGKWQRTLGVKCVGTPQWPTLGMVDALIYGLEGGGDNGGYILWMCDGHSLVASYSNPNFFSSHFGA